MRREIRNPKSEGRRKAEGRTRSLDALVPLDRSAPILTARCARRGSAFGFCLLPFMALLLLASFPSRASFVHETRDEFLTSGDFNGDGRKDALVLDKRTGTARVAFQNTSGALNWSQPFWTGAEQVTALAVGRFSETNREAIAVTSADLNRIHILSVSVDAPLPIAVTPAHAGTALLAGLDAPYGERTDRGWLAAGSHDPGITLLDLFAFLGEGLASFQDQIAAEGTLTSGNAFRRTSADVSLLAGMRRGITDAFLAYSYTNIAGPVLLRPNLSPGTEYVYGHFNQELFSRLIFYVPGHSNLIVQPLVQSGAGIEFGPATVNTFTAAIQQVFYVNEQTNGLLVVQFGDGVVSGLRPASGSGPLQVSYGFAVGPAGNAVTGIVPLGSDKFALLSGRSNSFVSAHAQVFTREGNAYVQTSSNSLPDLTTGERANVWLFQLEPFASSAAVLIGSFGASGWSSQPAGLPGTLSVRVETDGGAESGLGNPGSISFGPPPAGTAYVLANQFRDDISFFGYAPPRAPEPAVVTISPPPGSYDAPLQISFLKQNPGHEVHYRVAGADSWRLYSAPFTLTNNASIEYYANVPGGERGRIQHAAYNLGRPLTPIESPVTLPGSETNQPPLLNTNIVRIAAGGTVFYSRRGANNAGTIWAIDLDGSNDRFITAGIRPRVSRNGRWMVFVREQDPAPNQSSLWIRDLTTGEETRRHVSSSRFVGYDWDLDHSTLIFDHECFLWRMGESGPPIQLPLASDCRQGAPAINPLDGRIAFQVIYPGSMGLYLARPDASSRQKLGINIPSPRWPAWSPDGQHIAFADDSIISTDLDAGQNLWVVRHEAQPELYQITGFTDGISRFPNGVIWSPDGRALVGAGNIFGRQGLWVVPLTPGRDACSEIPIRLPTTPGDPIDFVGSIMEAPILPALFIRREPGRVVVFWNRSPYQLVLESTADFRAASWLAIPGPYAVSGNFFEHSIPETELNSTSFYRLRLR
jgi:hypothetical protein